MKVLIVDDDTDLLKMIERLLAHRGHKVSCCATPFGVSAMIVREPPDVVVLDMMMPGLSGGTLAEIIGRLDLAAAPKVVLWSAMPDHLLAEEASRLGLRYISKGERPSALVELIESLGAT